MTTKAKPAEVEAELLPLPPVPAFDAALVAKIAYAQAIAPTMTTDRDVRVVSTKADYSYSYITEGAIAHLHRSILPRLGVATIVTMGDVTPIMKTSDRGEYQAGVSVVADFRLVNAADATDFIQFSCSGDANDPSDKGKTKAFTTARRLGLTAFWQQGGSPDTEQDASADRVEHERQRASTRPLRQASARPAPDVRTIDREQLAALLARARDAGMLGVDKTVDHAMVRRVLSLAAGQVMPGDAKVSETPRWVHERAIDILVKWKTNPEESLAALVAWEDAKGAAVQTTISPPAEPAEGDAEWDAVVAVSNPESAEYNPADPRYRSTLDPTHADYVAF